MMSQNLTSASSSNGLSLLTRYYTIFVDGSFDLQREMILCRISSRIDIQYTLCFTKQLALRRTAPGDAVLKRSIENRCRKIPKAPRRNMQTWALNK